MDNNLIFNFKTDISKISIPSKLNNPFGIDIPEIAKIAAKEFQEFITEESVKWNHDFSCEKGKMFGILVVQKQDKTFGYLGTVSGKLYKKATCDQFVPSILDETTDDNYLYKSMTGLTEIGNQIKKTNVPSEIYALKNKRKNQSIDIQQWLFENYNFLNLSGDTKNLLDIFEHSDHGKPPAAAGECAAPKLLQHAIKHQLKPIALAEFWWGNPNPNEEREHNTFYPACKNRCRPILEYMLEDDKLFTGKK